MSLSIKQIRLATTLAAFVIAGGIGAAHAQQQTPEMSRDAGPVPAGDDGMGHHGMMGGGMMICRMGEHIEGRLAFLKAELKITDSQTPQWNTFADAFRANAQKTAQHCSMMKEHGGAMKPVPLPERLNMMEQHATQHLEGLRAIKGPAQSLYSALNDEQKKIADQMMLTGFSFSAGLPLEWTLPAEIRPDAQPQ